MESTQTNALNSSVLVLNRQYMAIHVIGVKRAFGLLLSQLAEAYTLKTGSTPITILSRGVLSVN